jgi:hypothetical protein
MQEDCVISPFVLKGGEKGMRILKSWKARKKSQLNLFPRIMSESITPSWQRFPILPFVWM